MDSNDMKELRELIEFLKANEIAEFDLEQDGLKVRLTFAGHTPPPAPPPGPSSFDMARLMSAFQGQTPSGQYAAAPGQTSEIAAAAAPPPAPVEEQNHIVKSPIVGTFYESPSPGAPAFVKVGDTVEVGQILCIVEAMKLMNEIESDAAGVIVERLAQSGQPVEYGQSLFSIKAS